MSLSNYFEPSPFKDHITKEPVAGFWLDRSVDGGCADETYVDVHRPRYPHELIQHRAAAIREAAMRFEANRMIFTWAEDKTLVDRRVKPLNARVLSTKINPH